MRIQSTGATRDLCAKLWSGSKERETAGAMEIVSASGTRLDSAPGVIQDWVSDGKQGDHQNKGKLLLSSFLGVWLVSYSKLPKEIYMNHMVWPSPKQSKTEVTMVTFNFAGLKRWYTATLGYGSELSTPRGQFCHWKSTYWLGCCGTGVVASRVRSCLRKVPSPSSATWQTNWLMGSSVRIELPDRNAYVYIYITMLYTSVHIDILSSFWGLEMLLQSGGSIKDHTKNGMCEIDDVWGCKIGDVVQNVSILCLQYPHLKPWDNSQKTSVRLGGEPSPTVSFHLAFHVSFSQEHSDIFVG